MQLNAKEKKYHSWKRYQETGAYADQLAAKKEAQALTHLTKYLRKSFEKDIAKNAKRNFKAFWRFNAPQMKTHTTIGDFQKEDGSTTSGNKETADALNNFFSGVFTDENMKNIPLMTPRLLLLISIQATLRRN